MKKLLYTCPCCGYRTFSDMPGSYKICHVCFWEDNLVQLLNPWFVGCPNEPSLAEAQENFVWIGASDARGKQFVRGVLPGDEKDPKWRLAEEADHAFARRPCDIEDEEIRKLGVLYYWLRNPM